MTVKKAISTSEEFKFSLKIIIANEIVGLF